MNVKPELGADVERRIWRSLPAERRLEKIAELAEFGKALMRDGLRRRFPDAGPEDIDRMYRDMILGCGKSKS